MRERSKRERNRVNKRARKMEKSEKETCILSIWRKKGFLKNAKMASTKIIQLEEEREQASRRNASMKRNGNNRKEKKKKCM